MRDPAQVARLIDDVIAAYGRIDIVVSNAGTHLPGRLDDIEAGAYCVEPLQAQDYRRVREVCDRYSDAGIGFVDAAVLAVVERLRESKLATLDRRHFGFLRPRHVDVLRLLPDG